MRPRLEHGDALEIIPRLVDEGVICDAVVTDPPYHLTARTNRFGKEGSAPPKFGRDGAMGRLSKGFMGQDWDGGDIAFRPETWRLVASIMRPGAFLAVFGGTRTYHRMTCAIEDAGFVIQDCLMWLYGTGFPKRRDMLKPAYEPIILAYKPGGDRTMQIDECRIQTSEDLNGGAYSEVSNRTQCGVATGMFLEGRNTGKEFIQPEGRWPANICHDGSDEVVELFPRNRPGCKSPSNVSCESIYRPGQGKYNKQGPIYGDSGSAARFFWSPKAGKKDRNGSDHPTIKPVSLMQWLVPLVTPIGGLVLDPFAGTGTTAIAAKETGREAILIEREPKFFEDIQRRFPSDISEILRRAEAAREIFTEAL